MATLFRKQQTQAVQRRLARRAGAGNIFGLAANYQRQINDMTAQYQTEFSQYQQMVEQTMAPFNEAMQQYENVSRPAYEDATAKYQAKVSDFERQLAEIEANPNIVNKKVLETRMLRGQRQFLYEGSWKQNIPYDVTSIQGNKAFVQQVIQRELPTFTEKAPVAPDVPVAPEIGEFDSSGFDQRRAALEQGFQREVAERRGARMSANRRTNRTMLSGTQQ